MNAVIFDMDGVLIDSFENHWKGFDAVMKKRFGFNVGRDEFLKLFGSDPRDITRKLLGNHGVDANQDIDGIYAEKKKMYEEYCRKGVAILPGVEKTLDRLKVKSIPRAVASSSSTDTVKSMMRITGLGPKFNAIIGLDDVKRGKPYPDLFLKAAESIRANPADCIVVEDSVSGVDAGKRAGMKVLGVLTGGRSREELESAGADFIAENLEKIIVEDLKI